MKKILLTLLYIVIIPTVLWIFYILFEFLIAYSYSKTFLSWIPYILLGGWVPGKLYELTLLHSFICIGYAFGIIGFFDQKIIISRKSRFVILLMVSFFFLYEAIWNFFFRNASLDDLILFIQMALIQFSLFIGIIIKAFKFNAEMN